MIRKPRELTREMPAVPTRRVVASVASEALDLPEQPRGQSVGIVKCDAGRWDTSHA